MSELAKDVVWVPLLEYAVKKGVSLSTLRRYIKAEKIAFKLEKGRYFIQDYHTDSEATVPYVSTDAAPGMLEQENIKLKMELKVAHKEISELKMLVAFYEEKFSAGGNA